MTRDSSEKLVIGWNLIQAGDLPAARQHFQGLTQAEPSLVQAWYLLGSINQLQGNLAEALENYGQALRLDPNHVQALNNLAVALQSQGMIAEAAACLRIAIRNKPDYADAHSNLGNALKDQGNLDGAVSCYRTAIAINPNFFDAYNNLGNALRAKGLMAESVICYEQALRIRPDNPQMRLSRALVWLQMGDFGRGWPEYEWRLKCKEFAIPSFSQPRWDGAPLEGRTILLYADHGLGDSLQFIRYAALLEKRGGRVIVACQKKIAGLLASCPGVEQVIDLGAPLPDYSCYAPLMSLPLVFETNLNSIPSRVPYLSADPTIVDRWRPEAGPAHAFKVGVVWKGSPQFSHDRQRSFPLAQLALLAKIPEVHLVSLQGLYGLEQLKEVEDQFAVHNLGEKLTDFMDIAAVMQSLDLVIAPDTSLAHLAGAFGVPVWLALSFAPDWRWHLERQDSPWYPSTRLFRQPRWGDWDNVFLNMAEALPKFIESRRSVSQRDKAK